MNKIDKEVASIYHEVKRILTLHEISVEQYVLEVPEEMKLPNISYSFPEITSGSHSLSAYQKNAILFLTVFHTDTFQAMGLAELIVDEISRNRNKIPLVDVDGTVTNERLVLSDFPTSKRIEEGVAQIEIHYPVYPEYHKEMGEQIKQYDFGIKQK